MLVEARQDAGADGCGLPARADVPGQGLMEGHGDRSRVCPAPRLAGPQPPFPRPHGTSSLFSGAPAAGPPRPGRCRGKGPGQGPVFAAFEPVILSSAQCATSAGAGGLRVYLRSPNRNKGSLGAGGAPGSPWPCRGVPTVGGMGLSRQSPLPEGTQPPPSCSGHHNVNQAQKREFSPMGVGVGCGVPSILTGQLRAASGCPSLDLGLVGCTRAQHPWGWVCKGQRARVGVWGEAVHVDVQGAVHVGVQGAGSAHGVGCARDSACGRAKGRHCAWVCKGQCMWAGGAVLLVSVPQAPGPPCLWAPVNLCLQRLWFTFDLVLYICKQL